MHPADLFVADTLAYPPWDTTTSRQAQRPHAWQLRYFVDLSEGRVVDLACVRVLLALQG